MAQPGGMDPDSRAQTATQHIQAEVEKASDEKQGSAVLGLALKNLGERDI
jgi:hypothetical protein